MGRKNRSDEKRIEIIQHAYDAVSKHGVDGATFSTIASYMEGNKSLISYYFGTKEELFSALVDMCIEKYESFYYSSIKKICNDNERIKKSVELLFSRQWDQETDQKVYYSCFYLSIHNEKARESFREMYIRLIHTIESELIYQKKKGHIHVDNPYQHALYILSLVEGFDLLWVTMGDSIDKRKHSQYLQEQVMAQLRT